MCTFPVIIIVFVDSFWLFVYVFFLVFLSAWSVAWFVHFFFVYLSIQYIALCFLLFHRFFSFFFFLSHFDISYFSAVMLSRLVLYCLFRIPSHLCFGYLERDIFFVVVSLKLAYLLLSISLFRFDSLLQWYFFIGRVFVRSCVWISFCGCVYV